MTEVVVDTVGKLMVVVSVKKAVGVPVLWPVVSAGA